MPRAFSLEPAHDLGDRQAELRAETARGLPASAAARGQLDAHPDLRPDAHFLGGFENQAELGVFLDDRNDVPPDLWPSMAVSMYSASLKPLQMIGVVLSAIATTASSSGFEPASRPKRAASRSCALLDDLPLLVHLDGLHQL